MISPAAMPDPETAFPAPTGEPCNPNRFKFLVCVDGSPQSRAGLRFAALRARNTGGVLAMLHVVDPPEFQPLMTVAATMEEESRAAAEALLEGLSEEVRSYTDLTPELHIRQGAIGEEILKLIAADGGVDALVVGAAPPGNRRGRLISWLAGQLAGSLEVPLVIVPGNLTDEQIERMT